jgi:hypothetical protein
LEIEMTEHHIRTSAGSCEKLPELPESVWLCELPADTRLFTADQMRAYALAGIRARGGGNWRAATLPPAASSADETGVTTDLALYLPMPEDGGPSIRQGQFDHCVCRYMDSMTGRAVEPMLWSIPAITPALAPEVEHRLVRPGEVIERGDEWLAADTIRWLPLSGWEVGMEYHHSLMPLRRIANARSAGEKS